MKLKTSIKGILFVTSTSIAAAPNPANQDWVLQKLSQLNSQINQQLPKLREDVINQSKQPSQGLYTSDSWVAACPSGESGLLAGCFTDGSTAGGSPIGSLINSMWSAINTAPNTTSNSVYIKKFPPEYVFSAISGRALTYNATGIPSTSKAWCTDDALSESGWDIYSPIRNNPGSSSFISSISSSAIFISSGQTRTSTILESIPGTSGALPLQIPIYLVCIGINTTTGLPASINGITVS